MRLRIMPYKKGSRSARALSRGLGVPRIRLVRTRFRTRPTDVIINWGCSSPPIDATVGRWINHPAFVKAAGNKLTSLRVMKASGVNVPEFTTRSAEACTWLEEGHKVVERALLTGSQGRGITLWEPDDSLMFTWCQDDPSPLFTKYEKKLHEYRVHVADGRVIDVQMKRRRTGVEDRDNQIRNFHNGWVYCREDIVPPADDVLDNALRAVRCLGLQFGAADIGWNQHYQRATVYEVNTAPGLEGTTLDKYLELLGNMVAA